VSKANEELREWIPIIIVVFIFISVFNFGGIKMKDFLTLLSGLLAPIIGIIAIYIAYQQKEINQLKVKNDELANRLKLKLDLYEKRFSVYIALTEILRAAHHPDDNRTKLYEFHRFVSESYFLFDDDVIQYLLEVADRYNQLRSVQALLDQQSLERGEERSKLALKQDDLFKWFDLHQLEAARQVFSKYLLLKELGRVEP